MLPPPKPPAVIGKKPWRFVSPRVRRLARGPRTEAAIGNQNSDQTPNTIGFVRWLWRGSWLSSPFVAVSAFITGPRPDAFGLNCIQGCPGHCARNQTLSNASLLPGRGSPGRKPIEAPSTFPNVSGQGSARPWSQQFAWRALGQPAGSITRPGFADQLRG